jgi:hypothetical protein
MEDHIALSWLVKEHSAVGYQAFQINPGEWAIYWPGWGDHGRKRVNHYRDPDGTGIGFIIDTVFVQNYTQALDTVVDMIGGVRP